ncbi:MULTISPECIES: hypothetical protein [unclassified Lebetimonas]|uniref:hypothetical protein n=1 Tax=unclassified Lebetimonas TaxID=2648158 RepID=UPI000463BD3D|nr:MULTISPECIES: hypothetical protein [unclassified Lebetimonas]
MKTIEIKIKDNDLETILSILNNLKDGLINKITVKELEQEFKEVKRELNYLKNNKIKPQKLEDFLNEI